MENKIKEVIKNVFNIYINSINIKSSQDNIENWDSLKHMNLLVALEEEFCIEFDDDSIEDLINFQLIFSVIKEKQG